MFTRNGDRVQLDVSIDDWESLLVVIGIACGVVRSQGDRAGFFGIVALANRLNEGNAAFVPYEVPPEFTPPSETLHWGEEFEKLGHDADPS